MHFVKESRIAASPKAVFAFHESKGALERLTPPWEKVQLVEGGDSIRPGSRVVLRTWLGPLAGSLGRRAYGIRPAPWLCGSSSQWSVCLLEPSPPLSPGWHGGNGAP